MASMDSSQPLPNDLATLWYLMRRVTGMMERGGDAVFRTELNISLAQFLVLSVVDAHPGPLNQQAIADRLGLTKGTISRQIDTAVTAGWMTVAPSPRNRREHTIALTPAGTDLVRRGDTRFEQSRQNMLATADPADLRAAIRLLTTMNTNLERSLAKL